MSALICKALPGPLQLLSALPNGHAWGVFLMIGQSFAAMSTPMITSTRDSQRPLTATPVLALMKKKPYFSIRTLTTIKVWQQTERNSEPKNIHPTKPGPQTYQNQSRGTGRRSGKA